MKANSNLWVLLAVVIGVTFVGADADPLGAKKPLVGAYY